MARRRKSGKSAPAVKKRVKEKEEDADGMRPPNHNPVLELYRTPDKAPLDSRRYPLLRLMIPDSPGCGLPKGPAFVAELHNLVKAVERDYDVPPTWMDPEVFIRMCKANPQVMEAARRLAASKHPNKLQPLVEAMTLVFEENYLMYVSQQFDVVAPVVAEWLRAHVAYKSNGVDKKKKAR